MLGLSVRALSQSARSAGYAPLAADFFCDLDTREAAEECRQIAGSLARGFEWEALARALDCLASNRRPVGVVCGSGFEDRSELLDQIGARWPLLGNSGATVAQVSDPGKLAKLCARAGVPHPRWSPTPCAGWLAKQIGGSGGTHVTSDDRKSVGRYWQERIAGEPVSALVLANGTEAFVLGLSAQWADPARGSPYRYGGAARPASLPPEVAGALSEAARKVSVAAGLIGLNSVDFLVAEDTWHLIEVNPRPGATMDIFQPGGTSLFALHVEACRGLLPPRPPAFEGGAAARIVYARRDMPSVPEFAWPDWTADRQPPGTALRAGEPLCTVTAFAAPAAAARRLVEERGKLIAAALDAD